MQITTFIIDAFSKVSFKGNPACVCLLKEKITDEQMQLIAFEMNLSETAFISLINSHDDFVGSNKFKLRWFTPKTEIKLCGHATLASAFVLFNEIKNTQHQIQFETLSGILTVSLEGDKLVMDFPVNIPEKIEPIPEILQLLGLQKQDITEWNYNPTLSILLIEVKTEKILRSISPNFEKLKLFTGSVKILGLSITAEMKTSSFDFSSRYFAPWKGVNEDPVTGSSHTILTPYWSKKMNKNELKSIQLSQRTGELELLLKGNRVFMKGYANVVLKGNLSL